MRQALKKQSVSAYPASILWGTCPFTSQTTRRDPESVLTHVLICEMLNFFNGNLVHPAISQVIFVRQLRPIGPDSRIELCSPTISDAHAPPIPIRVREAIHGCFLIDRQPEQIEMGVLPTHHNLKHFMEGMKADATRTNHVAPSSRLN